MRKKQIISLVKQEIKLAYRSKYLILMFILLPILLWTIQGSVGLLVANILENQENSEMYSDVTLYISNHDPGNGTVNMGKLLVDQLKESVGNRSNALSGVKIDENTMNNNSYSECWDLIKYDEVKPIIYISDNFTTLLSNFNHTQVPIIKILGSPKDNQFAQSVGYEVWSILQRSPFIDYITIKDTNSQKILLTFEGEESAGSNLLNGMVIYITIILAVMAPQPFVSNSVAGEREKKTLESLLSLPIKRFDILFAKIITGWLFTSIFAISNITGLYIFAALNEIGYESTGDPEFMFEISSTTIIAVLFMLYLTSFIALGVGISIASIAGSTSSSDGIYVTTMMFPSIFVGLLAMQGNFPLELGIIYLLPWSHSIALLNKGMFPKTYSTSTITGSIVLDLLFHTGYLLLFVILSMFAASKLFAKERIL